ncbi:MAG: tetratricopeptide repeat protein [Lentisphaerae bacterium]|nr:tetratricopeptide repeat protein [Lentisphaerota bacterium]
MTGRWTAFMAAVAILAVCAGCGIGRSGEGSAGERLDRGWDRYRLGEFSLALKDFEAVAQSAQPGSSNHLAALYAQATTWNLRRPDEDTARAERLYRQVIALAPTNDLAAWSWLALARRKSVPVGGETPPLQPQVEAYQEVIDRFPFHLAGEEAFLHQQAARLEQPDEARTREVLAALETFLRTHPQSPWRGAAYGLVEHCCAMLGLREQRVDAVFQAWRAAEAETTNRTSNLSWTYWKIATLAEFETGDFTMAREYYRKFIAEYPTEQRVFLAKQELKRMDELEERIRGQEQP